MRADTYGHKWTDKDHEDPAPVSVVEAIKSSAFTPKKGASARMKSEVLSQLLQKGWAREVEIDATSGISITSIRGRTGLCFQTGNIARMYADLLKLQTVFSRKVIDRGVLVIPTKACAKVLGSNIANYERLTRELAIFDSVITVPLLVVGAE